MVFDLQRFFLLFSRWVCDPEPLPGSDGNLLVKFSLQFLSFYIFLTELKLCFRHCKMRKSPPIHAHFCRWNDILCVLKNMVVSGLLFYQQHHHSTSLVSMETSFPSRLISDRCESAHTAGGGGGGEEGAPFLFKHDPGSLCSLCTTVPGLHVYVNEFGRFWVSVHHWVYTICRTCTNANITII